VLSLFLNTYWTLAILLVVTTLVVIRQTQIFSKVRGGRSETGGLKYTTIHPILLSRAINRTAQQVQAESTRLRQFNRLEPISTWLAVSFQPTAGDARAE